MLQRLAHLPRDTRDTLFLLAVIVWVVLPQVGRLPLWCSALTVLVLLWRGGLALKNRPLPGMVWRVLLLVLTLSATFYTHGTLLGRDAGVTLVVVLLALKTLELRARRDAFVVFFLGFFAMLTNFLYSQSLLTAAAMLVALLGLLTALVNAHMVVGKPPLRLALKTAGRMALLGAPIMAALFMLFPRLSPLWGIPSDGMSGRSGLSGEMKVGNIARLVLDDGIAMRIRFEGTPPAQADLYFRGPVLGSFDGREWRALPPRALHRLSSSELQVQGEPVRYQVTLEPSNRPWLLLLEATPQAPALAGFDPVMTPDLVWFAGKPMTDIVRYSATSYPLFRHGPMQRWNQDAIGLQEYLYLPGEFNPRTRQLANELRRDPRLPATGPERTQRLLNTVLERLRTGGYVYTLEPGTTGEHSADEFWFDSKQGFCEHIASAFVILMRNLDIPARIVTGYQGGERNPVDGYWVLRQSDAHAWAEIWIAGQGWVRVDPTGMVAPGRIGSFERLQAPAGIVASALGAVVSPGLLAQLRNGWEALNNGWNQWVLNYTQSRQLDLLRHIGFETPGWEDLSYVLIGLIVTLSLIGAGWSAWERRQHDPWLRLLAQARRQLQQAGLPQPAQAPPRELARRIGEHWPAHPAAAAWQDWLLQLEQQRYAAGPARQGVATLRQQFQRLQRLPTQAPAP